MANQEKLTEGQQKAAHQILNALGDTTTKLVIFEGLLGTGKHTVLNAIAPDITAQGGTIREHLYVPLSYGNSEATSKVLKAGPMVTTGSMRELLLVEGLASKIYPERGVVRVSLQAMTQTESLAYAQPLLKNGNHNLTAEELAEYSMGVHTIVQMLSVDPKIPAPVAARIAGAHLGSDLVMSRYASKPKIGIEQFLAVKPADDVLEAAEEQSRFSRHIYNQAGPILKRVFDLGQQGVDEASPLFVSPQSVDLYNKWAGRNSSKTTGIFAPEIPAADFGDFNRAFGLDYARQSPGSGIREGTRVKAFGVSERELDLWFKEPTGRDFSIDMSNPVARDEAKKYETEFTQGKFPVRRRFSDVTGSFLFLTYETRTPVNIKRAWMVESWLQQKGLAYFVHNPDMGNYTYNPDFATIELTD